VGAKIHQLGALPLKLLQHALPCTASWHGVAPECEPCSRGACTVLTERPWHALHTMSVPPAGQSAETLLAHERRWETAMFLMWRRAVLQLAPCTVLTERPWHALHTMSVPPAGQSAETLLAHERRWETAMFLMWRRAVLQPAPAGRQLPNKHHKGPPPHSPGAGYP
jgi:hypothetical protein